jgi:hypothetical protein
MENNQEDERFSEDCMSEVGEGAASFIDNMAVKSKIDLQLLQGINYKYPLRDGSTHGMTSNDGETMRALIAEEDCKFSSAIDDDQGTTDKKSPRRS